MSRTENLRPSSRQERIQQERLAAAGWSDQEQVLASDQCGEGEVDLVVAFDQGVGELAARGGEASLQFGGVRTGGGHGWLLAGSIGRTAAARTTGGGRGEGRGRTTARARPGRAKRKCSPHDIVTRNDDEFSIIEPVRAAATRGIGGAGGGRARGGARPRGTAGRAGVPRSAGPPARASRSLRLTGGPAAPQSGPDQAGSGPGAGPGSAAAGWSG